MLLLDKLFHARELAARRPLFADREMPLLDHLDDLRRTLVKIIVTQLVATLLCFAFNKQLLAFLFIPIDLVDLRDMVSLQYLHPTEAFTVPFKISMYAAVVLGFPLHLWFVAGFVVPGLKGEERRLLLPSMGIGFGLFLVGAAFAFLFVCPATLKFFAQYGAERGMEADWRVAYYVSFVTRLTFIFGMSFELPVVVMALVKLELLTYELMRSTRSYAIVAILVVAAIITPTPDALVLSLLGVPMILLYELCIWLARWLEHRRIGQERT